MIIISMISKSNIVIPNLSKTIVFLAICNVIVDILIVFGYFDKV